MNVKNPALIPSQGVGVGLRSVHYPRITSEWPAMDWFEAISENYMDTGGRPLHILEKVRGHYPVALHGTSLSIGSADPLDPGYLNRLKRLIERIEPFIVSDHLCWCGVNGEALHDLLPLPFTEEAIQHVVKRVQDVQEFLGRQILLENVSTYVTYRHSVIPEWEFLREVARQSGCGILLDLNNLYVNSFNHKFDADEYLRKIPAKLIGQFHLAGHTDKGDFLFDTHSAEVIDPVWKLYEKALRLYGPVSTLIEWDENIPAWERLAEEAEKARRIAHVSLRGNDPKVAEAICELRADSQIASPAKKYGGLAMTGKGSNLLTTQRWIKSRIQPRERQALKPNPENTLLNPQGGASGEERMSVYATGYLARIRETLQEVYEAVRQIVGEENFDETSKAYALAFPSKNYNLNYAGRHFPEFLKTYHPLHSFDFLPDLARLEWFIWESFHAFDEPPLGRADLKEISPEQWENARFIFQPSVRLLASSWPILDYWRSRRKTEGEIQSHWVLISRPPAGEAGKDDQVHCELMDENRYRLLSDLIQGKTLGEACEVLAHKSGEEMPPVSEWFSRWLEAGLILQLQCGVKSKKGAVKSSPRSQEAVQPETAS